MEIIVIKNVKDFELVTNDSIVVIEIAISQEVFKQIVNLSLKYNIDVYKKITNKYQKYNKAFSLDCNNYFQIDILNPKYNSYLGLTKPKINQVRNQISQVKQLLTNSRVDDSSLVINQCFKLEPALQADSNFFHKYIDGQHLCLTTDASKYFSYSNQKTDSDTIVSKSNRDLKYNYYFIPESECYKPRSKLVIVSSYDYKYAVQNLLTGEYHIGFDDQLKYSSYFQKQCNNNQVLTTYQVNYQNKLFESQCEISLATINLVEANGSLEVYEIVSGSLQLVTVLEKDTIEYQLFVLNYKNSLEQKQGVNFKALLV